jgi:hypothetical protein
VAGDEISHRATTCPKKSRNIFLAESRALTAVEETQQGYHMTYKSQEHRFMFGLEEEEASSSIS